MRRDVTVTAFGSRGNGQERLIPFSKGSTAKAGGFALNKWDENRMSSPYVVTQRQAGINCPYMRFAELLLMYAEVECDLGNTAVARDYLNKVHQRAFGGKANLDAFIAKCGDLRHAIYEERKLEFGGEGVRKWDVIRSGYVDEIVTSFRTRTKAILDDLQNKGYHTFANGNQMSLYVWIKDVNPADYGVNYRLTTTCTDRTNPVLWPAWRGQNDDWYSVGKSWGDPNFAALKFGLDATQSAATGIASDLRTNVAVKGMFEYIDPDGAEAKALEADGYVRTDWGKEIIDKQDNIDAYYTYIYNGYESKTPPIYMFPMHGDVIKQNPEVLIQGYGFQSK